jgi:hypothetical protein
MSRNYDYKYQMPNDADDDNISVNSRSNRQKVNKVLSETVEDRLCFKTKRFDQSSYKMKPVIMFGSGDTGSTIRNAVTGEKYYGHRVGSRHEDLYFKARICTGEFSEPATLFYESVEQYERHTQCVVDNDCKAKFAAKQRAATIALDAEREVEHSRRRVAAVVN